MPLQIRRGPTADRLAITPLEGEIVYDTQAVAVYIGDGVTPGGIPVSAFSVDDARLTTARMFLGLALSDNSIHSGITFQYVGDRLVATVSQDLTNYPGTITAEGFIGNLFASDSTQILDAETGTLFGRLSGDVLGSVFADDSTKLVDGVSGSINLDGTVKGDIVPDQNEVYDIGSSSNRFKDIYLSGSSIYLGDAVITSAAGVVDLPPGSTIGGNPFGIELGQTYEVSIIGDVIGEDSTTIIDAKTNNIVANQIYTYGNIIGNLVGNVTGSVTGSITGHLQGSVFGDDSSTQLIDGADNAFNLDGTIKANVVPFDSEIHNLGSFTKKFKTLYLTEGANLYLGNAVISSSSTTIDLPAGSTIGGSPIGSGAGSGDVVGPAGAVDNSIALFDGTTGKLVKSSTVTISSSTITASTVVANVTGSVTGDTFGNHFGNVVGDLKGSVVADDSTLIVDGTNGTLNGSLTGNVTGDLQGNVTGNVTGTVTGNLVGIVNGNVFGDINGSVFADDSTLIVDGTSRNVFGQFFGPIDSDQPSTFKLDVSSQRIISIQQAHDDSVLSSITMSRSRGSSVAPTTVVTEDGICNLDYSAFNGTSTLVAARIKGVAEGTITGSAVPGRIEFITADSSGTLLRRMYIDSVGQIVSETSNVQVLSDYASGAASTVLYQNFDNANPRNFLFAKSRGSYLSPTSVTTNDILGQISFNGYESGSANYIQAGAIRATAQTVSSGVVTSSLSFLTNDGSTISARVSIGATGRLNALNSLAVSGVIRPFTTNGDLVLDSAVAGSGEVRTTSRLSIASRVLIEDNKISTLSTNDDIELDPNGTGTVDFQVLEQTTVGSAGPANALPATPSTYFKIKVNGVEYVVPAYAVS